MGSFLNDFHRFTPHGITFNAFCSCESAHFLLLISVFVVDELVIQSSGEGCIFVRFERPEGRDGGGLYIVVGAALYVFFWLYFLTSSDIINFFERNFDPAGLFSLHLVVFFVMIHLDSSQHRSLVSKCLLQATVGVHVIDSFFCPLRFPASVFHTFYRCILHRLFMFFCVIFHHVVAE